ncbi:MAG: hypothetical protein JWN40_1650 [Phycisphaerales bacterium]|nr:hypothetical protein [Phycisphaerales bacterium]
MGPWAIASNQGTMTTLTREQLNARLRNGHHLERRSDGGMWVQLRDELVPKELFAGMLDDRLIEEVEPGQWALSEKGRRRIKRPPSIY